MVLGWVGLGRFSQVGISCLLLMAGDWTSAISTMNIDYSSFYKYDKMFQQL